MKTIWKYEVRPDAFVLEMPKGAKVLSVAVQHVTHPALQDPGHWLGGTLVAMWALVDPDAPKVRHRFVCTGTGIPLPDETLDFTFVGSFVALGGRFMGHVFDAGEEP